MLSISRITLSYDCPLLQVYSLGYYSYCSTTALQLQLLQTPLLDSSPVSLRYLPLVTTAPLTPYMSIMVPEVVWKILVDSGL